MKSDAKWLRRLAGIYFEQARDDAIDAAIMDAVRRGRDTPRHLSKALGLSIRNTHYRLRRARDDIERERRGEPTRRELLQTERAEQWRRIRIVAAQPKRRRGRPRKVA